MKKLTIDKPFYKRFMIVALPIVAQQFLRSVMYFIDNIMIGSLGESAIVGVGNANQIAFFILITMIGICAAGWVFAARFNGEGDKKGIRLTLGVCLIGTITIGAVFFVLALTIPQQLIGIFSKVPSVKQAGGDYIQIVGISYIFTGVALSYSNVLKGCEKTRLPMITSLVAISVNAFLNYVLIFGKLGFPQLGVKGAAIGTAVGVMLDAALLVIIPRLRKSDIAGSLQALVKYRHELRPFLRRFFKVGSPMMINEVLWALYSMVLIVLYNIMGLQVAAAMAIYIAYEKMAIVIYIAIAHSSGVMVGNQIGEGKPERAYEYGKRFLKIGPISTVFVGIVMVVAMPLFLAQYDISQTTIELTQKVIYVFIGLAFLLVTNFVNMVGVLRGGGDTRFCMWLDAAASWLIILPVAYVTALVLHWPVYFVILCAYASGEIVKLIISLRRFRSKKWIHDITSGIRGEHI